ncbi:hypothetical protein KAX08_05580 [candidate division WOR-3 bacterium]|nr:hypothetical protein [candidate division WOR-3 bacterium]
MKDIAFEIFTIKNGKKDKVWKISLNSRIEGFEDVCVVNHVYPKIMSYEAMINTIQQQLENAENYIKRLEMEKKQLEQQIESLEWQTL